MACRSITREPAPVLLDVQLELYGLCFIYSRARCSTKKPGRSVSHMLNNNDLGKLLKPSLDRARHKQGAKEQLQHCRSLVTFTARKYATPGMYNFSNDT